MSKCKEPRLTDQVTKEKGNLLVRNPLLRLLYQGLAVLCIVLGVIGALLPLMPTTVFLLMALWLSVRSSPKLNQWLLGHPRFGPVLKEYLHDRALSPKIGYRALALLWLGIGASVWLVSQVVLKILLGVIALAVSSYLWVLMRRYQKQ
ncbi:YbaN family protein [Endozoicomonas sp. 8E]|uniref:YbaN family protein n=1 Tax=Endozoicomonas sp. 8E TaxID=3035692 RepID=UPI0029392392|nr:YbaN family protein [Endozoicomonas sp. 8E]WOG27543.1 YbaN family protein [Endozoicomonas sp. 8E]